MAPTKTEWAYLSVSVNGVVYTVDTGMKELNSMYFPGNCVRSSWESHLRTVFKSYKSKIRVRKILLSS